MRIGKFNFLSDPSPIIGYARHSCPPSTYWSYKNINCKVVTKECKHYLCHIMTQCTMCQCVQLLHMIDTDYLLYSTCIYISFRFKSVILGVYRPLFHYISRPNPPHSAYPPWLITVSLTSHFSHEIANPIFPPLEFGAPVPCSSIPSVSQCLYVIKTNYITWMFC